MPRPARAPATARPISPSPATMLSIPMTSDVSVA
jgi:hypothetical protein